MNLSLAASLAMNEVLVLVKERYREGIRAWAMILKEFDAADDKSAALQRLTAKYAGTVSISQGTLYRKRDACARWGYLGLAPATVRNRALNGEVSIPEKFVRDFWHPICAQNQRKISPAYRELFARLRSGEIVPGYGNNGEGGEWRDIYCSQNPGWPIPLTCPYQPHSCTPRGWTERNLRRYAPDKYALEATRIGRFAARKHLPLLPTTRAGLGFCQCFVIDDVYHDAKLTFANNRNAQIAVEMGALELLTGHYCTWGIKPVRERDDGTREHLREAYTRYLLADICCRVGVSAQGCLICGEHGTARLPDELQHELHNWLGDTITFDAGGLHHAPIAKGLFEGRPGGNFRFKAALESHHNLKKNELAQLPGQKGADPEHSPEDLATREQYHRALMKACIALADQLPDLVYEVHSPFPNYYRYIELVSKLYDRIADRQHHSLEGFEECGFTVELFRLDEAQGWAPLRLFIEKLDAEEQELVKRLIRKDPSRYLRRLMSPLEAFDHCTRTQADDLVRLPSSAVPAILGRELGDVLTVAQDNTLTIRDKYLPGKVYPVASVVETKHGDILLDAGTTWLVHLNPLDIRKAFISTAAGEYVGEAPVLVAGSKVDQASARRNLGIISRVEAAELKRLAPIADKSLRDQEAMHAHNVRLLTGRDPVAEAHAQEQLHDDAEAVSLTDEDIAAAGYREGQDTESMDLAEITALLRQ